ncbi:UNVERIFIED_CONTAM: permease, partial [Mumia flava]
FVLIAIPLAYVNPRLGRYTPMIFAVLIYLTYSNLLNLSQAWVSQGKMTVFMAWWPIHLVAFICAMLLFRFRHYSAAGLKGISALLGFAPKKAGAR